MIATTHVGPWPRVSHRAPCVICHHTSYCQVSWDGQTFKCMREPRGAFKTRNGTEFYHRINGSSITGSLAITSILGPRKAPAIPKADAHVLHAAYTALLEGLTLSAQHADELTKRRRLSEETVTRELFSTTPLPSEAERIVKDLAGRVSLEGVPGFYKRDGRWSMVDVPPGFFVPVRDSQARIVGMQIRLDDTREGKYKWFSSAGLDGGVSSGSRLHFAKPYLHQLKPIETILVTEGALKADCISEIEHIPVVGLPGINCSELAGVEIREAFPDVPVATLLPDADWQAKPEVHKAAGRAARSLERAGFAVNVRVWDLTIGKGFDDCLVAAGEE